MFWFWSTPCYSVLNLHQTLVSSALPGLPVQRRIPKSFQIALLLYASRLSLREKAVCPDEWHDVREGLTPWINTFCEPGYKTEAVVGVHWTACSCLTDPTLTHDQLMAVGVNLHLYAEMHAHVPLFMCVNQHMDTCVCECGCFQQAQFDNIIAWAAEFGPSSAITFFH